MKRISSLGAVGLGLATVAALAVPSSGALAASPLGGAVHPVRTPQGNLVRNVKNEVTTQNWSGYAVASYQTNQSYTSATATWVVPTASPAPGVSTSYSSSWVGIGGYCTSASCSQVDSTLIQLGTEQDASSTGATQYYAWWETLPRTSSIIRHFTVSPGDTIVATLSDPPLGAGSPSVDHKGPPSGKGNGGGGGKGSGQSWTLTMTNETTGQSWTKTISYNSSLASAEWIEEAPYSGGILPLANFGTVTFDPGTANGVSPNLNLSNNGIVMVNTNGQTSNVSSPDSEGDGFNACWGNGTTLTSCSAPAS